MLHEQQLAVGDARKVRTEATGETKLLVFLLDGRLRLLPINAIGRIRNLIAERLARHLVICERVAEVNIGDVATLENGVRLTDGVGLPVYLLRVGDNRSLRVYLGNAVGKDRKRTSGSGARVAHLHDAVGLREVVHLADNQQLGGKAQAVAWTEVLTGCLVRCLGELSDEFLVDVAHVGVADRRRAQVDLRVAEAFDYQEQQVVVVQVLYAVEDLELVEDVGDFGRERRDVLGQVLADAISIREEPAHRELARVVEVDSCCLLEHRIPERIWHLLGCCL